MTIVYGSLHWHWPYYDVAASCSVCFSLDPACMDREFHPSTEGVLIPTANPISSSQILNSHHRLSFNADCSRSAFLVPCCPYRYNRLKVPFRLWTVAQLQEPSFFHRTIPPSGWGSRSGVALSSPEGASRANGARSRTLAEAHPSAKTALAWICLDRSKLLGVALVQEVGGKRVCWTLLFLRGRSE